MIPKNDGPLDDDAPADDLLIILRVDLNVVASASLTQAIDQFVEAEIATMEDEEEASRNAARLRAIAAHVVQAAEEFEKMLLPA